MKNAENLVAVHTHTHTHTLCLQDNKNSKNLNSLGLICVAPNSYIKNRVDIQIAQA